MRRLRILQVGCGARAQYHLAAMQAQSLVDIVGLCDLDDHKLHLAGERFGITARYSDMAHAIADTQPDLVDIVTPPHIRLSIVKAAISAGAPAILIEKPIALTPRESDALAALGQQRLIAVNTQYQWMPHWQQIWQLLDSGALGTIRAIRASTGVNILEQGPHILDLALTAARHAGLPAPTWVMASCDGLEYFADIPVPADTSAVCDLGEARLWFNAGPSAPLVPGEQGKYYQQQVEISGDRGRIWVSLNQGWYSVIDGHVQHGHTGWPGDDEVAQPALFGHLHHVLCGDGDWHEFPTRIAMAHRTQQLMFTCYASAIQRRKIMVAQPLSNRIIRQIGTAFR